MANPSFRKTTAMVASLSLLVPQGAFVLPAHAQEAALFCVDGNEPPCPEGEAVDGTIDAAQAEAVRTAAEDAQAAIDAAALAEAQAQADALAAEQAAAEAQAQADALAAEQAAAEAQAQADALAAEQADAEAQAQAEALAAEQAAAEAQAQADALAAEQAAAEAKAQADALAAEQADAEAQEQAEAQAAEQAAAEAAQNEQPAQNDVAETAPAAQDVEPAQQATDTVTPTDEEAEAQAQADLAAAIAAERAAEALEDTAAEEATDQTATEQPASDTSTDDDLAAAIAAARAEAELPAQTGETTAADDDGTQTDPALVLTDPTVTDEEEAEPVAAAAALADADAPTAEVEVVEETVSEETTRASNEDFATAADGQVRSELRRDEGLSNLEKVLLLGLGAVVVGAVLKNGDRVVTNSGDRLVVETPRGLTVYKDDDALLRQAGSNVRTETFNDGSSRTILDREDGTKVITIRDSRGRVLSRARVFPDGTQIDLFDDVAPAPAVDVRRLDAIRPAARSVSVTEADRAAVRNALRSDLAFDAGRSFSLRQIREIEQVRSLMPAIDLDSITFASGSAAIPTEQARSLVRVGLLMEDILAENPREVFLIEGHTDATGSASFNLVLSDRRAESVALGLTENFRIPPENLVVQGYGEEFLKINTQLSEAANRRATVRRITPLLRQAASN